MIKAAGGPREDLTAYAWVMPPDSSCSPAEVISIQLTHHGDFNLVIHRDYGQGANIAFPACSLGKSDMKT